jgi:hypothetical protein
MTRRTITFLTALAAAALLAIGGTGVASAKHGADDPAGHVRHNGADDGKKHKKHRHHAKHSTARHGADDPANHDAGDDRGGNRPAGTSDDPAGHR